MNTARRDILGRIRAANTSASSTTTVADSWETLPRSYRITSEASPEELLHLLEERLHDYDATVTHSNQTQLRETLCGILSRVGVRSIVIPLENTFASLLPDGFEFVPDRELSVATLDGTDAVLTGCTCAIADTGTLVLQAGPNVGRRALTLVPDVHICMVAVETVVATVPEAFALIAKTADIPTTFVSGPSATADIEMTRVKGVHGPRFLHVVLVHGTAGGRTRNGNNE